MVSYLGSWPSHELTDQQADVKFKHELFPV